MNFSQQAEGGARRRQPVGKMSHLGEMGLGWHEGCGLGHWNVLLVMELAVCHIPGYV